MSILENENRVGSFTSSEIYRLLESKKVRETYIEEKKIEIKLGRSINTESYSNDMAWGTFLEKRVNNILGLEYRLQSNVTTNHPTISNWSGSTDFLVFGEKIAELKCYQPKKFAQYTDAILKKDCELLKNKFPKEFWQLVSNAIINKVTKAEAITYMPYKSELEDIRDMARNFDDPEQWKYRFIAEKEDSWLAWIPDCGFYKNLNIFEFDVEKKYIDELTEAVIDASVGF